MSQDMMMMGNKLEDMEMAIKVIFGFSHAYHFTKSLAKSWYKSYDFLVVFIK